MKGESRVFIILRLLKIGSPKKVYLSCKSLPKYCKKGFIIAYGKRKISFLDVTTLKSIEFTFKRYRGAASFLDAMIASESK